MQFQKTKNRYVAKRNKSSRNGWGLTYYPETGEAYSYGWWRFAKKINGIMIINLGQYSQTTTSHQQEFLWFYKGDRITIDIGMDSLNSIDDLDKAMENNAEKIKGILEDMSNTNKIYSQTNKYRINELVSLVNKNNDISKMFNLENPSLPLEANQIFSLLDLGTGSVKVGKKVYNFYKGDFTSPEQYVKLTSKLGQLL